MRSTLLILIVLGFFSLSSTAFAQMNASAGNADIAEAILPNTDVFVTMEASMGEPIPVKIHLVRVLKLTPFFGEAVVPLRTCNVTGCLPERNVSVGPGESIIKFDVEFTNTLTTASAPGINTAASFSAHQVRFNTDGIFLSALELINDRGAFVEQEPSFYIDSMKRVQQTFFVRVPKDTKDVKLVYGKDFSRPLFSLQGCFSESCPSDNTAETVVSPGVPVTTLVTPVVESGCKVNGKSVPCEEVAKKVGMFAKMGLSIIIGLIIFVILCTVFWVMMLVHVVKHQIEHKAIWVVGMFIFGIFVSIAYYFAVKRPFDAIQKNMTPPVSPLPAPPLPPSAV